MRLEKITAVCRVIAASQFSSVSKNCSVRFLSKMSATISPPKVFVTRYVPPVGLEVLSRHCQVDQWDSQDPIPRAELLKRVKGIEGLYCLLTERIDKEVLDAAGSQLKVVATMSVGYDHVDVAECRKRNIKVGFTPDVLTNATAELTVSLLLNTSRRIYEGIKAVREGNWGTWNPVWMCGQGLDGATVGIVGLGRIGFAVAQRLKPFGVEKFLYTDSEVKSYDSEVGAERVAFDALCRQSDFILGCCALTDENKGLFNKDAYCKMKKTAILINTSRGGLVNQEDLYVALSTGQILAAGLDVTVPEPLPLDSPLMKLDNCIVLPHIGSATEKSRAAMSELTGQNIVAALKGEKMPREVPY
ncbi:glyoxylate reductase/hydroxypyruvate reductase-like [Argopecten irradians]|uniref:glyoxylate reductase/hydroxypyruvate reductase-like n=1 Tax=Argopecten irradians TaxID=31199 RepID=UPI003723FD50